MNVGSHVGIGGLLVGLGVLGFAAAAWAAQPAAGEAGRIQPYPKNRFYWQHKGKSVLLLGGSVEDNLFQISKLAEHLDTLAACGGNYVRCVMSSRDEGDVWPFAKAGRGGKYDLDKWNGEYWRRFETFLAETARRDVIVQIEVWATFDYYRDIWAANPLNPANNVTYTAAESGLPTRVNSHPVLTGNDFFRSVPEAKNLPVALKVQQRFVEKLLSYSLKHTHVLYTMDNETSVTPKWGAYWSRFIRQKAKQAGRTVETTEMWDKWDINHRMHDATFDHPELYSFVDISQNNHNKGQTHYDNMQKRRRALVKRPRPLTCVKIYGADGGRFGNTRDGIERFWRNVFGGLAAARFHRPDSGIGLSKRAQRIIRSAREVTGAFDVFTCEPRNDLLGGRKPNEAYCLARPARQYAVYFPAAGEVTLDAKAARGELRVRWYEIDKGKWRAGEKAAGGGTLKLKTPGGGQWAVIVLAGRPR